MFAIRPLGVLYIVLIGSVQSVYAVDGTFDLGETIFDPSEKFYDKTKSPFVLSLGAIYTDNYNALLEPDLKASSLTATVKGNLVTKQEEHWFEGKYLALTNQYNLSDNQIEQEDGFSTFDLGVNNRLFFDKRWSLDVNLRYTSFDEQIGTGISRFRSGIAQNDAASIAQGSLSVTYGADRTYRSIQFTIVKSARDYDNVNAYSDFFDLEQDVASLYSNFRISDQTQLIALLEYRSLTYEFAPALDSDYYRFLTGAEWLPGGKSKVLALIGAYQRRYDVIENTSGVNWELAIDYFPREDLLISFGSQRRSTSGVNNELSVDTIEEEHIAEFLYFYSEQWRFGIAATLRVLEYQELQQEANSDDFMIGISSQVNLSDHSVINFSIGTNTLKDQNRNVDFRQNSVNLAWQYEF
ncbi:hypothetical protein [Aliiglaciecola sp. M165]|uniref:hypothetical protein n=1 Tax=Aliiglaciecola sp. M165 TaxID=2593649 RepID=UPI00117BE32D|nr:hypothetical protein [Aliiglaciecola sp. M165]TRY32066.1 hypothetical protein FM019_09625 [Aliiglaciecola sp. M165]